MQWIKSPIAGLFVIGLSTVALLSASEMASAATAEAEALQRMDRSRIAAASSLQIQQSLPIDLLGPVTRSLTEDPILKLAHCCHPHPVDPYTRNCCHPRGYVRPLGGVRRAARVVVRVKVRRKVRRRIRRRRR